LLQCVFPSLSSLFDPAPVPTHTFSPSLHDALPIFPLGDLAENAPHAGQGDDKCRQGSDKAGQTIQRLRPHYSPTLGSRRTLLISRTISMALQKNPRAGQVTQFCVNRT